MGAEWNNGLSQQKEMFRKMDFSEILYFSKCTTNTVHGVKFHTANLDYIATNGMITKQKGFGRKQEWPN